MNKEEYKYIALIPAYNPDEKLEKLIEELSNTEFEVVVVNDGSKPTSLQVFNNIESKCHVIHHEVNKGKGVALKTGLSYIREKYTCNYIVVTMDCDGQHTIKDAHKLCNYNVGHPEQLVLGSRKLDYNVPLRSKVGNTITRKVYSLASGVNVYDTQTGLRSFSNRLVDEMLEIKGNRYEYEINVLLRLAKEGVPIKEITIETIYIDNNSGSHFHPIKDSFKIYKEIFKFSLSSLLSFFIDVLLYSLFLLVFQNHRYSVQISNVIARVFSACFNYTANRNYVFKQKGSVIKSFLSYVALAICILTLNTIILTILVSLSINSIFAKVLTELILFTISYIVQHKIIFKGDVTEE